ncbi:MAG: DUF1659 domain-containing protein [Eubacterium sp.]
MAIDKTIKSVNLKVISNYGQVGGKSVLRSKSYNNIKINALDPAIYNTYEYLTKLQQPAAEECIKVTTEGLIKTV